MGNGEEVLPESPLDEDVSRLRLIKVYERPSSTDAFNQSNFLEQTDLEQEGDELMPFE